jgi:hypothetical protein
MRYSAVFALDDPDALVGASLSCPSCLSDATRLSIGTDLVGRGACGDCGTSWSLSLEPRQLLRLSLDPPATADVRFSRGASPLPPGELS